MRKFVSFLATTALAAGVLATAAIPAVASTTAAGAPVVIAQVYGGGGNQGGVLANDFVEVFNRSAAPVSLQGWSLQYTSATGTNGFGSATNTRVALTGTLQPGQTLLIQGSHGETAGQPPLPAADVVSTIQFHQNNGRVALVTGTDPLGCNTADNCSPAQLARIVDLVGYGTAAFFETAPAPALTNPSAAIRLGGGCVDTDNNAKDLAVGHPTPRNSFSPLTPCATVPAPVPPVTTEPAGELTPDATAPVITEPEPTTPTTQEPETTTPTTQEPETTPDVTVPAAPALVPALPDPCAVPIMQPVNCDGSSVFKLGSTIPLKFEIPNQGTATFSAVHVSAAVLGDSIEGTPVAMTASNGTTYRYSGAAYHYNWSTKGLKAGTYRVSLTDAEGVTHTVRVSLRP